MWVFLEFRHQINYFQFYILQDIFYILLLYILLFYILLFYVLLFYILQDIFRNSQNLCDLTGPIAVTPQERHGKIFVHKFAQASKQMKHQISAFCEGPVHSSQLCGYMFMTSLCIQNITPAVTSTHVFHLQPPCLKCSYRTDSRLAPSQWEASLQSTTVSHWLGVNL